MELRAQDGERLTPPWEFTQSVTVKARAELGMKERGRKPDREGRWCPYGGNCRLIYVGRVSKPSRENTQVCCVVDQRDKQKQVTAKKRSITSFAEKSVNGKHARGVLYQTKRL